MTINRIHRLSIITGLVLSALVMVCCGQEGGQSDTDTDGGNPGPTTGDTRSSITQYQFTWTFDRDYRCGQFVNGDFWVVGPVTITAISPGWDGEKNGSMIDPLPQNLQGYDARASYYDAGLTADRPADMPLTLQPGSSLVSTLGLESSHAVYGRSFLRSAAVLTVLDTEPPDDAFRPPYASGSKPLFRFSDVEITALPILAGTAATPDTNAYMSNFQLIVAAVRLFPGPGICWPPGSWKIRFQPRRCGITMLSSTIWTAICALSWMAWTMRASRSAPA